MKRTCVCVLLTGLMIGVAGCQTSASSGSGGDGPSPAPGTGDEGGASSDWGGTWTTTMTDTSNCGDPSATATSTVTVTQSGNSVTAVDSRAGSTLTGTISGGTLNLTGSYPTEGGTTQVQGSDITLAENGNSFSGTMTWTWTQGDYTCAGYTTLNGTRQ